MGTPALPKEPLNLVLPPQDTLLPQQQVRGGLCGCSCGLQQGGGPGFRVLQSDPGQAPGTRQPSRERKGSFQAKDRLARALDTFSLPALELRTLPMP